MVRAPLDVVCQQLIGMACAGDQCANEAFDLIRKAAPMAELRRADFDACLDFLAGKLGTPAGAVEAGSRRGTALDFTAAVEPRGQFGLRSRRVARWFRSNVGTIHSEETVRVIERGVAIGTLEAAYAERLVPGDRFVLDGRALEFRRLERSTLFARSTAGEPAPAALDEHATIALVRAGPRACSLSERSRRIVLSTTGHPAFVRGLPEVLQLDERASEVLVELFEAQVQWSEIPSESELFVESSPSPTGRGFDLHVSRSVAPGGL